MLQDSQAFSGFSVHDITTTKEFYGDKLGLQCDVDQMGMKLRFGNGTTVFVYPKTDHVPATFTILNFPVEDIDATVMRLTEKGVVIEKFDLGSEMKQDEKGILRGRAAHMGPDIAWFKDPSGNVLSVLQG